MRIKKKKEKKKVNSKNQAAEKAQKLLGTLNNYRTAAKEFFNQETPVKYGAVFAVCIVIALLLEIFIFNFKYFNSLTSVPIEPDTISTSGITQSNNNYKINSDNAVIEFKGINKKIKYIYFDPGETDKGCEITISACDEANANYLSAPSRTVYDKENRSKYIRMNFSGEVEDLKINIKKLNGTQMSTSDIVLNTKVPMMFSFGRFAFCALFMMAVYLLRPKSSIYKIKTNLKNQKQLAVVVALLIVQSLVFLNMIQWNTFILNISKSAEHQRQYYELIESWKDGHLYVSDDVPEKLMEMDNPYDPSERGRLNLSNTAKWDHAYYNGKYYSYFGALPVFLMYLPYNLMTGKDLPHYAALYIMGVALMAGVMYLMWQIIKKWFKNTPLAVYLLLSAVFPAASALAYTAFKPDFYMVPGLSALMFSVWGIALWLSSETTASSAKGTGKTKHKPNTVLIPWRLALGSLFIAFTAGCRPQFLISAFIGVIFFWKYAFSSRDLFSKKGMRPTIAVCAPFVIFGAVVMWYNAARFGSPFDFGANYNITSNDMTHRGMVFGRNGLGLFTYFLQPFNMDALFPFIHGFSAKSNYQGLTLSEQLIGGVMWLYPIIIFGIAGVFRRKLFDDKRVYIMVLFCTVISAVLAMLDAQMAGLLTRYYTDFVWLIMLAAVITIFAYYNKFADNISAQRNLTAIVCTLSAFTLAFAFLSIFGRTEDAIVNSNPELYYRMQHLIAFWM